MPTCHGSYDKVGHSQLMKAVLFGIFFMLIVIVYWLTSACPTAHNLCLRLSYY